MDTNEAVCYQSLFECSGLRKTIKAFLEPDVKLYLDTGGRKFYVGLTWYHYNREPSSCVIM